MFNSELNVKQTGNNAACAGPIPRQVAGAPVHGSARTGPVPRRQRHGHAMPRARRQAARQPACARRTARRAHRFP